MAILDAPGEGGRDVHVSPVEGPPIAPSHSSGAFPTRPASWEGIFTELSWYTLVRSSLPGRVLRDGVIADSSPAGCARCAIHDSSMLTATLVLFALMYGGGHDIGQRGDGAPLAVAHSHNDYEQRSPLFDAVRAGFRSVEADVWLREREVVVSHESSLSRGSLEDLYLVPLQERVDRLGSVNGDGRPFYLWIDLKESRPELTDALHALLARYPMLTVFTDEAVVQGPVIAILTGDEEAKTRYTNGHRVRLACRDSNEFGPEDAAADRRWTWYALPWHDVVEGDERGSRLVVAYGRLRAIVAKAHQLGRRLRLYDVPERREAWSAALGAGVDLISTDQISPFRSFLTASRPRVARADRRE